ncbi:hypothetical protein GCM10011414_11380 [Croceivirga lutea]|uniref:T9SS type A sorting domain-containing protein n=1 Tax=Croceivirga lutea TaxID=1775167 RepID=UPI0016398D4F|nr:T9SS type A sorting domain-containing protein [Croceivirga lutea]GGG43435.1 hypothetical protein GCM10011414_11380 [Croceivirga lutea]
MKNNFITIFFVFFFSGAIGQSDIISLGNLPAELPESSGLILIGDKVITHNDSGDAPVLYELDTTSLQVTRTVEIQNESQIDWEDIAQDDNYIYIGDFGNNNGDRRDLAILRVLKSEFLSSTTVNADRIDFAYEDQEIFLTSEQTDWDAEALTVQNDSLLILTKQWVNNGTVAYKLPKTPGQYLAKRKDSYDVNGLVTGADFNAATNELYLSAYTTFLTPFFVKIEEVQTDTIFNGAKAKTSLDIGFAQVESIVNFTNNKFYVSSETFNRTSPNINSPAQLYYFTLDTEFNEEEEENEETPELPEDQQEALLLFKEFGSNQLNFQLNTSEPIFGLAIYNISGQRVWYRPLEFMPQESVDISTLSPSIYFLSFSLKDGFLSKPFVKN